MDSSTPLSKLVLFVYSTKNILFDNFSFISDRLFSRSFFPMADT